MTVENICQTALTAYYFEQQMIFFDVKSSVESAGGEAHHRTNEAGYECDSSQMELSIGDLNRKEGLVYWLDVIYD